MKAAARIGGKWDRRASEMARRIGEAARARRVVLFGSAARGDMTGRGDWDFLVVIADRRHRWKADGKVARALHTGEFSDCPPADFIVARESEIERWRDCQYSVIHHALKDGREVWRA